VQLTDQITISRLAVVAALGVTAFQAITRRTPMPQPFLWPEGVIAVIFFLAVVVSSLAHGTGGLLSRIGPFIIYAAIFFVVLTQADDPVRFRRVLWIIVLTGVLQSLLVLAEAFYGFTPFGGWHAELAEERGEEVRVVGTHAHPITLAGFFQVAIPIAVGLALTTAARARTLLLLGFAALFAVSWWYTFARSSWIGMVVLVGAAMLTASRTTRVLALAGGFVGFVLLVLYDFSPGAIIRDIESLAVLRSASQLAGVAAGTESFNWRLENWAAAWSMFLENPLFGVGLDQSPRVAFDYLPLGSSAHTHIGSAVPHNIFLQLAAEAGGFALAAFVALCVLAFRALRRAAGDAALRPYAVLVFAVLSGLLATFFFNPMPREIWLALALALVLGRMSRRPAPAPTPRFTRAAAQPAE
jgi:O-antigen ligase